MLVRAGRFMATNPEGLYPSFHVDALISQLTTWDKIAEEDIESEGSERKRKTFVNTTLGRPYEIRGDAPDHERLFNRREDYPENQIPPLGLLVTAGADIQHDGVWVEIVAWAPDRQSWTLSARWLGGDTTNPDRGAFLELQAIYDERFEDAFGNRRLIDAIAIDAGDGGRANQVYAFTRGRHRAYAIKGLAGWNRPPLGSPTKVQITLKGEKVRGGAMLWPVGTYELKAEFYANIRKGGRKAGAELDPPGYCHFGAFLAEAFFVQITAEHLADAKSRGRNVKIWQQVKNRPNHFLDCQVYAAAVAEHLGLTRKTRDQWQRLAQRIGVPVAAEDLFAPAALVDEREAPPSADEEELAAEFARSVEGKPTSVPTIRKRRFRRMPRRR